MEKSRSESKTGFKLFPSLLGAGHVGELTGAGGGFCEADVTRRGRSQSRVLGSVSLGVSVAAGRHSGAYHQEDEGN